jgi:hypothetical protein
VAAAGMAFLLPFASRFTPVYGRVHFLRSL